MHNAPLAIAYQFNNTEIKTVIMDGQPWFNATSITRALGYKNSHDALAKHVDTDDLAKREVIDKMGRKQKANFINESGMYALIFGSTKPQAKEFKNWVTREVLPQIRKTGGYGMQDEQKEILAFSLAAEVASVASRTVFESVMAGNDNWKYDRWLFTLNYNALGKSEPIVKTIKRDAMVFSLSDLPSIILDTMGFKASNEELAELASACNQRLAEQMKHSSKMSINRKKQ